MALPLVTLVALQGYATFDVSDTTLGVPADCSIAGIAGFASRSHLQKRLASQRFKGGTGREIALRATRSRNQELVTAAAMSDAMLSFVLQACFGGTH